MKSRTVSTVSHALMPENQISDENTAMNTLYPLRFLGMGVFIAWLCCTHVVDIFPGNTHNMALRLSFDTGMRFGDIGTFFILALLATKIGPLSRRLTLNTFMVFVTTGGTALIGLVLIPNQAPETVIFFLSLITAIGGAILFCLWAEVYCQMGIMQTIVYGALSCITAAVVSFVISIMTEPYAIAATALLPLFSFIAVTLSHKIVPHEPLTPSHIRFPIPWKLLAIMAFTGFMSGLAGTLLVSSEGIGAIHRVLATGLAGVVILTMVFALKERCDVRFLAKVALPLSIFALAFIPFAGPAWAYVISFLLKLAYVWFTFFVLLVLANISRRFEVPSLRLFAIARASSELAMFMGVSLRRWVQQTELLSQTAFLFAVAIIGIVLILVCVLIWMSEKSVNTDWGASGVTLENPVHVPGPREQFLMRCEKLAETYSLTAREAEILGLIAQRKSRIEIEQELFLSQNTVKTHVRHLYAKLDVHAKEDIYQLF